MYVFRILYKTAFPNYFSPDSLFQKLTKNLIFITGPTTNFLECIVIGSAQANPTVISGIGVNFLDPAGPSTQAWPIRTPVEMTNFVTKVLAHTSYLGDFTILVASNFEQVGYKYGNHRYL